MGFDGNAGFNVTVCLPDRSPRKVVSLQLLDRTRKMPYWVARNDFVEVGVGVLKGRGGGLRRAVGCVRARASFPHCEAPCVRKGRFQPKRLALARCSPTPSRPTRAFTCWRDIPAWRSAGCPAAGWSLTHRP